MTDGIIKGTGNSRYLRLPPNAPSLYPSHEALMIALAAGEVPFDLNGINPLGWEQEGTPLNKETLLKDETAEAAGLTADAVPDDVLSWLIAESKKIVPITRGGTGNANGLAASATQLATARTIQTNLGSTSAASFNGTANVTPGVTGVLPVVNGGTGETSLNSLVNTISASLTGVAKIATGTYIGTGKDSASITTSFVPELIFIINGQSTKPNTSEAFYPSILILLPAKYNGLGVICTDVVKYLNTWYSTIDSIKTRLTMYKCTTTVSGTTTTFNGSSNGYYNQNVSGQSYVWIAFG